MCLYVGSCHPQCNGYCWRHLSSECQILPTDCHQSCRNECYRPGSDHCCASNCTLGCHNSGDYDCLKVLSYVIFICGRLWTTVFIYFYVQKDNSLPVSNFHLKQIA